MHPVWWMPPLGKGRTWVGFFEKVSARFGSGSDQTILVIFKQYGCKIGVLEPQKAIFSTKMEGLSLKTNPFFKDMTLLNTER